MIEKVQIRATKLVDGLGDLEYEDRLKKCNLTTLLFRRMRGDMMEMFKHFNMYEKAILPSSFIPNTRPTRNEKHRHQLYQKRSGDGQRGTQTNSYYFRVTKRWNELPSYVTESKDTNNFKIHLDKAWLNHPLKYNHRPERDL